MMGQQRLRLGVSVNEGLNHHHSFMAHTYMRLVRWSMQTLLRCCTNFLSVSISRTRKECVTAGQGGGFIVGQVFLSFT